MHSFLTTYKPDFETAIDHLENELSHLRTGRAHPALVEEIPVEAYGSTMDLKGVASVSVQDARTLLIQPWDKQMLKPIETAIQLAKIGIQPVIDGDKIRLTMPQMTEESRKNLVKVMKERLEDSRIALRGVREKIREQVLKLEKEKAMGEDEKFKILEELDKTVREYGEKVEELGAEKEKDIMTI